MGGRKVWAADDVLAAADLNEYLGDQVVMVFANATARSGAILAPVEGMLTYRQDDDVFEFWTGSVWRQIDAGTAGDSDTVGGITVFNTAGTPVANAVGDLWFY
jgi:hypothetical protein